MAKSTEPDSDKLLDDLRHAISTEAYLESLPEIDRSLSGYLGELLREKGLSRADAIREAGIGTSFGYFIFKGERGCGRDTALKLALAMGLDLTETQRLLTRAGRARLWPKDPRDAVIIRAIDGGLTRTQCDDELYRLGLDGLLDD